jgi:hypothetical protein
LKWLSSVHVREARIYSPVAQTSSSYILEGSQNWNKWGSSEK